MGRWSALIVFWLLYEAILMVDGQQPVFDTLQFQDTTTIHCNSAFRNELLDVLQEFPTEELSRSLIAFRVSLSRPRVPSKPNVRT